MSAASSVTHRVGNRRSPPFCHIVYILRRGSARRLLTPEDCSAEDCTADDCTSEDCICEDRASEDCTSKDCTTEDCASEDCTTEGCTTGDCTSGDCSAEGRNTGDLSAEDCAARDCSVEDCISEDFVSGGCAAEDCTTEDCTAGGTTEKARTVDRDSLRGSVLNGAPGGGPPGRLVSGVPLHNNMGPLRGPRSVRGSLVQSAHPGAGQELARAPGGRPGRAVRILGAASA